MDTNNKKFSLVIMDTDYEYLRPLEQLLIRSYTDKADIHLITSVEYMLAYCKEKRHIDMLIIDASLIELSSSFGDMDVEHALVLISEIEDARNYPDNVNTVLKYVSYEEILQTMNALMHGDEEEGLPLQEAPKEKKDTKIISVFSPIGGCGKSLIAYGLGRKLLKIDQTALVIGCDSMQSLGVYLNEGRYADTSLAKAMKDPQEDAYWIILQNMENQGVSILLPFEKNLHDLKIDAAAWKNLLAVISERQDFSYIILDLGSEINAVTKELMHMSDQLILVTEADGLSSKKMSKVQSNLAFIAEKKCILVENRYSSDTSQASLQGVFGSLGKYSDVESALEDPLFYSMALAMTE